MTRERDQLLTTTAVAKILGLSADMVRRLARSGKLSAQFTTTSGVRCFRLRDVEKLARARGVRGELEPPDAA
jgi:excisionase family DNA binding protein